jgi:ABC-2 type transport system ATP-binding protein
MGSVEELCDNIALINKAEKILDGRVRDIKKMYRTNTYKIAFRGGAVGFTHALWTGAEITNKEAEDDVHIWTLKAQASVTSNQLLQAALPHCEVLSFNELIPTMNDIFILKVSAENTALGTASNFTE